MRLTSLLLLTSVGLAACSDSAGPNDSAAQLSLSFTTSSAGPSLESTPNLWTSQAFVSDTVADGGDTLILEQVQLVLREVELERLGVLDCDSSDDSELDDDSDDGCEEFEVGPILLDLPLNGEVAREFAIAIEPGTYGEIEFEIHKPEDSTPEDSIFLNENPGFERTSIRARGSFNGQAFSFDTDLDVEQELVLNPPLEVVEGGGSVNVTILVDLAAWFRDNAGNLIDPATANKGGPNEGTVKDAIKDSFEAFEDDDEDGRDDDSEDD